MKRTLQAALAACGLIAAAHAAAQVTFYEGDGFRGRSMTLDHRVWNFNRTGFNDRASSVIVEHGRWEVCEHAGFEGRCVVLRRGSYPSLREFGMNNMISSARPVEPGRAANYELLPPQAVAVPQPQVIVVPREEPPRPTFGGAEAPRPYYGLAQPPVLPVPERRPAYYEVPVTSVHAVMGPPSQRCWIEREQVAQPYRNEPNVGGAIVGGLIGGILGHQIGGGSGKDLATVGGAVAGAAVGANVNRNGNTYAERDVQRCQTVSSGRPAYWDVTYFHDGIEHRVQTSSPPGPVVRVNEAGFPIAATR